MRFIETIVAWSLLIGGGIIGSLMIVVAMLELLPEIIRDTWNGQVHW